jgi:hypothetical protein
MPVRQFTALSIAALAVCLMGTACSKSVSLKPTQIAGPANGAVNIELTYDRNNRLDVRLTNLPDPASLQPQFTRYVLWVADPEKRNPVNTGQLRVDDNKTAKIQTLTPRRRYVLFITAEPAGDVLTPSPHVVFESPVIDW